MVIACWRVYRTILLMLQHVDAAGTRKAVVTVAALEFPECWRLVAQAEDRMRVEQ